MIAKAVPIQEAFEQKYGLPIVREHIGYVQLLEDIRSKSVKEIHWFKDKDDYELEGPCLVEYENGIVKQSVVPPKDFVIPAAMTAHHVKGSILPIVPTEAELNPVTPVSEEFLNAITHIFPLISLLAVYLGVRYMNWLKGDMADRDKMRQKEKDDSVKQKVEEYKENIESEAETLANMGYSVKEIVAELKTLDVKYDLYHVKNLVDRAQKRFKEEEAAKAAEEKAAAAKPEKKKTQESKYFNIVSFSFISFPERKCRNSS